MKNRTIPQKRSNRPKQQVQQVSLSQDVSLRPPPIHGYQLISSNVIRFIAKSAQTSLSISQSNLMSLQLVAASATAVYTLFDEFKIKKIRVWAPAIIPNAPTAPITADTGTINVQFIGADGDDLVHSDTSYGTYTAFVEAAPSMRSRASMWREGSGFGTILLTCPEASIIDLHIAFRSSPNVAPTSATAGTGLTPGEFYYRGLDGLPTASSAFVVPRGLQQA